MMSTLVVGRSLLASSIKLAKPKYLSYNLHHINKSTSLGHQGFLIENARFQQPIRQFSKSQDSLARFGTKVRAEPFNTTAENVSTVHNIGMIAVGCGGAAGLAALCYYGLGMANVEGARERSILWPQYVRDRIHSTYGHLGVGFGISTLAACAAIRSPAVMRFFSSGSIAASIGTFAALIGSSMVVQGLPYESGLGVKQLAWVGHCSLLGLVLCPLSLFGGPALLRAATYTAGIVGGLSTIAVCAPSEKFLINTAPLSIGLGAVVASSIGALFLPPTSRIGLGLQGITIYGGLIVFSGLLLYDTQKTIKRAELHPAYSMAPYDPINNSLHIYMDIINIFIRLVPFFSGNQRRR